ncbi:MAG: hypothetical protein BJ554DRAFT_6349 [Olpidium bornovanus]|uniref:Uncharacterized protein n=1 Tax=Olpidium bornovanus TaxID=278681 RepID=A0A8H8DK26_9FUNG|nr:MAG: hypothetical protein BJ554DRAFT_6349 [Olpidium bornovanus]
MLVVCAVYFSRSSGLIVFRNVCCGQTDFPRCRACVRDFQPLTAFSALPGRAYASIDTPGVIECVSNLFHGDPELVQGFNTFLPPGYRIESANNPHDPNAFNVTTPNGTTGIGGAGGVQKMDNGRCPPLPPPPPEALFSAPSIGGPSHVVYPPYAPAPLPGGRDAGRAPDPVPSHLEPGMGCGHAIPGFQPILPPPMSGMMPGPQLHEPRSALEDVSLLPAAVRPGECATTGGSLPARGSRPASGGPTPALPQPGAVPYTPAAAARTGGTSFGLHGGPSPGDMEDHPRGRGQPVEFNHAIDYVNKIKVRGDAGVEAKRDARLCHTRRKRAFSLVEAVLACSLKSATRCFFLMPAFGLKMPEPLCRRPRYLQGIPRDTADVPKGSNSDSGGVCTRHKPVQELARPAGGVQAVFAGPSG